MPKISRRIRCFICSKWMEVGEDFVWKTLRAQGLDRKLPMHPEHDSKFQLQKIRLNELKEEAAANGHGNPEHYIQEDQRMADADFHVLYVPREVNT